MEKWRNLEKATLPIKALNASVSSLSPGARVRWSDLEVTDTGSNPVVSSLIKADQANGSSFIDWISNSIRPQQAAGNQTPSVLYAMGRKDFGFITKHIRPEFASRLDQYFDLYGYAQDKIAVPQRYVRNHWTYVKTRGCTVKGNIPASANAEICAIYDSGIRWYHYTAEVGRYDESYAQGNVPLGG